MSLHTSRETRALMDELGFHYSFTPVYSPAFNGIEEVFSQAKGAIKKARLDSMMNG